jgi:SPP1 family predicted phage head-tail adaptor
MLPSRLSTLTRNTPRGAMEHQVSILSDTGARDSEGTPLAATDFADTWAAIIVLQGRELDMAQQIMSEVTHKITIPYQTGVQSQMSVSFGTRVFEIQAILNPDERNTELQLLCIERNP